jgi:hypothetical protein
MQNCGHCPRRRIRRATVNHEPHNDGAVKSVNTHLEDNVVVLHAQPLLREVVKHLQSMRRGDDQLKQRAGQNAGKVAWQSEQTGRQQASNKPRNGEAHTLVRATTRSGDVYFMPSLRKTVTSGIAQRQSRPANQAHPRRELCSLGDGANDKTKASNLALTSAPQTA